MELPYRVPKNGWLNWLGRAAVLAILGLFLFRVVTQWSSSGVGLLADALIVALAVTGVNLITGYTGQLSIGHAAFFAIGAYASVMLVEGKVTTPFFGPDNMWSPGWTIPVAALVCFLVGCLVSLPALRLKGIYLALVTLVFVEAVRSLFRYEKVEGLTGGSRGLRTDKYLPPEFTPFDGRKDLNLWILWLAIGLLVLVAVLLGGLLRSRIGRAMVAIRDNETAASVMGVNRSFVKTLVFGLSGAITGLGGSLFALRLGLVNPDVPRFGLFGAITFLVAMFVGGAAQSWGPIIGATFYVFVDDYARGVGEDPDASLLLGWLVGEDTKLDGLGGVVFGVLLVLFARFTPLGAVGSYKMGRSRLVQTVPAPPAALPTSGAPAAVDADSGTTISAQRDTTVEDD